MRTFKICHLCKTRIYLFIRTNSLKQIVNTQQLNVLASRYFCRSWNVVWQALAFFHDFFQEGLKKTICQANSVLWTQVLKSNITLFKTLPFCWRKSGNCFFSGSLKPRSNFDFIVVSWGIEFSASLGDWNVQMMMD